jgi:hypothetical protein
MSNAFAGSNEKRAAVGNCVASTSSDPEPSIVKSGRAGHAETNRKINVFVIPIPIGDDMGQENDNKGNHRIHPRGGIQHMVQSKC